MNELAARILIADDERRAAESVQALVRVRGHATEIALDGAAAIEALTREHFDLVLLDLHMPRVDGHGVMEFINQEAIDSTVIVVSGDTAIDSAIDALRLGAYDYLRKPYAPEMLLKSVANALRKRHLEAAHVRMQARLQRSEQMHRYMVDSSPDIIYMLDHRGHFKFINVRVKSLLGFEPKELVGKHYAELVHPQDLDKARYAFNERRTGERATMNVELRLRCKDSSARPRYFDTDTVPIELSSMGMYVVEGENRKRYVGTYGIARDVTERKSAEQVILYQAFHDQLTALPNRALFRDRVQLAIAAARRERHGLAILFLDLDRFKVVNDSLGHARGDELLQLVATRLKVCIRGGDTIARVGGDEFTVLVPNADEEQAYQVARKLREQLKAPFMLDGRELFVSASIGIALYPEHGEQLDALIKHADIAMYHVKDGDGDGIAFYREDMESKFSYFLCLESGMRRALEHDGFELVYQPIVDVGSGETTAVEALMRWHDPEQGVVSPTDFVPHAEECGLIAPMGEWVLRRALRDYRSWLERGVAPRKLSVNVSAAQLTDASVRRLLAILAEHGFGGELLQVEITENVIMKDLDRISDYLNLISAAGARIAIDDFGTGYSSLSYLQRLPIHAIKVDRSFVSAIDGEQPDASIVDAIVALAHGLGLELVAEGVETEAQRDYLLARGCRQMQGYLFSHPLPAAALPRFVGVRLAEQRQR